MTDTGFLAARLRRGDMTLTEKLWQMSWSLVFWLCAIATIGFFMLYSAANASLDPWTTRQAMRFGLGLVLLLTIAMIDIRLMMRYAYPLYAVVLVLLVFVEARGVVGGG
ncbi:MAG: rod shape-determining protein RodA, partial [Rhodospirillaceae bacterium]|nr:rod shape-determining protein RodA [Rhodospirillaceae bacterium]